MLVYKLDRRPLFQKKKKLDRVINKNSYYICIANFLYIIFDTTFLFHCSFGTNTLDKEKEKKRIKTRSK